MIAYLVRRTLLAAFTLLVISFISFVIVQLPAGDLVDQYDRFLQGVSNNRLTTVGKVRLREEWGLNDPLIVQWWH